MGKRSTKLELRKERLEAWLPRGLVQLLTRVRAGALGIPLTGLAGIGGQAQRFGESAWSKIAARWPMLAELAQDAGLTPKRKRKVKRPEPRVNGAHGALSVEAIDALVAQLMVSSSWQARASAANSLANAHGDGVVPALIRALRDRSVEVAVAAVDALSNQSEDSAVQELLLVLENGDGFFSPVTRVAAITGLARRLDTARFDPVFAALRDIDAEVSIAAVSVIAERVPHKAGPLLLPVLCDKSGYYLPIVRLAVANALERSGALHAGVVGDLLVHESDPSVQRVLERAKYLAEPQVH